MKFSLNIFAVQLCGQQFLEPVCNAPLLELLRASNSLSFLFSLRAVGAK